jgi:hypothetical protein
MSRLGARWQAARRLVAVPVVVVTVYSGVLVAGVTVHPGVSFAATDKPLLSLTGSTRVKTTDGLSWCAASCAGARYRARCRARRSRTQRARRNPEEGGGFATALLPGLLWWSGRRDSNPRPQRPERCALTKLRYFPMPALACAANRSRSGLAVDRGPCSGAGWLRVPSGASGAGRVSRARQEEPRRQLATQ